MNKILSYSPIAFRVAGYLEGDQTLGRAVSNPTQCNDGSCLRCQLYP